MKFYTDIIIYKFCYYYYITSGKLTCIHFDKLYDSVVFYKNGQLHNSKKMLLILVIISLIVLKNFG